MKAFKSTLLHMVEFLVVLGAGLAIIHFLDLNANWTQAVTLAILSGFLKLLRASGVSPMPDWINR